MAADREVKTRAQAIGQRWSGLRSSQGAWELPRRFPRAFCRSFISLPLVFTFLVEPWPPE